MASPPGSNDGRLLLYVLIGLLGGAAFVGFDIHSESLIGAGTMSGRQASVHAVVDHVLPLLVGPLLGISAHYLRLRSRLTDAEKAAARSEALRTRLQKVERDQALWLLAAVVLHELNNPLHALRLLLDELESEPDAAGRADLLRRARSQTERLVARLAELRSMREVAEPRLEALELESTLSRITADAEALAGEEGLRVALRSAGPVLATVDPSYLRTIVENLVDNSLQSLRQRGHGEIVVDVRAEADRAVVRVSDDGPGLDPDTVDSLFEPMVSTKQEGLGLGLPIARALARAIGGDLRLDDAPSKTFRLELPLEKAT